MDQATPEQIETNDRLYKTIDPSWSACPCCAGIKISVCTNGCGLSPDLREKFAKMLKTLQKNA